MKRKCCQAWGHKQEKHEHVTFDRLGRNLPMTRATFAACHSWQPSVLTTTISLEMREDTVSHLM